MLDVSTLVTQQGRGEGRGRVTFSFLGRNKKKKKTLFRFSSVWNK